MDDATAIDPPEADRMAWESLGSTQATEYIPPPSSGEVTGHQEDTAIVAPGREPEASTILGEYRILSKLGEGAMGAVFKARQIDYEREVALKVLFPHVAGNPKLVERLYREGRVMGQLDHPNIIQAYGVGEDKGYHYVAMEFVEGESLQKWLNKLGRLEVGDALHITLAVARALGYAHDLGLVHRDIKPDNILIDHRGRIKVADLGMVKMADDDMAMTQTGHAVGTPWYMPLEQARNAKDADGRCDIYALGCMLYCLLTGAPPFTGKTIIEVIQAKEIGSFPPARSANPSVPERLDLIIAKMAAKLPKYRYQTCNELAADIESLHLATPQLRFLTRTRSEPVKPTTGLKKAPSTAGGVTLEGEPDTWYVRVPHTDGTSTVTKLKTQQVRSMLEEGSLDPRNPASRKKTEGFRALATYKEFQGTALHKASKQAADEQGARFRNLMKSIEEKDRRKQEAEKVRTGPSRKTTGDIRQMILPACIVGGVVLLLVFLYYIGTGLGR